MPTDDSIVRSSIRQLRLKLAEYYGREGAHSPWIIEIPRGAYVVQFRRREAGAAGTQAIALPGPVADRTAEAAPARRRPRLAVVLAALLIVSAALNLILISDRGNRPAARPLSLAAALIMQNREPTRIVLDDFAFVLLSKITDWGKRSVDDYSERRYTSLSQAPSRDPHLLGLWELLSTRHIVSLGAAATLDRLHRSLPDPNRLVLIHARNMTARAFGHGNSIIVGSLPNNPWSAIFEEGLNFERKTAPGGRISFVNRAPRPGEQAVYTIGQPASMNSGEGYARIAYVSNRNGGFVLLLNGVNMVTAEAAGEYATDPARVAEICRLFGIPSLERLPHMELLLRTAATDNSVRGTSVVAWRRLD